MKKQVLRFKLREIAETSNGGYKAVLVCDEYTKSEGQLDDLMVKSTGKMTYYLYLKQLGEGQKVGVPEVDKFYNIEHSNIQGTDEWIPSSPMMKVIEQEGTGEFEGMTFKKLIILG